MSLTNFSKIFLKIFPVPKSLKFDFVGVDICQNSVRVIKLSKNRIGKIPVKYHEYILRNQCGLLEAVPDVENCDELIGVLKTIKKDFNVDYINVSIPENNTYIYRTTLPKNVGYHISKTLEFSIEENVPISPNDALLDYFVLGINSNEISVIVTVVPKSIIEKFTSVIESAGLKPLAFEPATHAIARGIIKTENKNQCMLLSLDNFSSNIAIVQEGIVQYTQTLPVTNNFAKKFDEEEAQVLKESINKIIIYWSTSIDQADKDEIKNMFLVGENSFSTELLNYLEKNISLNVKFANVWVNCFDLDNYIPEISAKDSLGYATAVGLSLKNIK